jgi:hypothetical protein
VVARELDQDPIKFHSFYRINIESFKLLVEMVAPEIRKKVTNFWKAMTVKKNSDYNEADFSNRFKEK